MWKASGKEWAVSMESVDGSISMAAMGSSDSRRGKDSLKFQKQESNILLFTSELQTLHILLTE